MAYYTASLYASVECFLVLTSSLENGPIVGFSGSFTITKPSGAPAWTSNTHSIESIASLTIVSASLSGSDVNNYVLFTSASTHVDINRECDRILDTFISGSNFLALMPSVGLHLH